MSAQELNFVPIFLQNGVFSPRVCILGKCAYLIVYRCLECLFIGLY